MAHQHYKGTGQMHSFRGLLADGGEDRIRIEGATGEIAWRITKFQALPTTCNVDIESTIKIYRESQAGAIDELIDFRDDELLAGGIYTQHSDAHGSPEDWTVIFDNALFVRNIYVTLKGVTYTKSLNYYIELEEIKVGAAGMAQLAIAAARRT